MHIRDILVTLVIFGALPVILKRPYFGILMWSWISYMNPHRLTWGFAYNLPFAQVTALATLVALLVSKEPGKTSKIPVNGLTILWGGFLLWMTLTTLFALYPDSAMGQLEKVAKIQLFTILTIVMINDRIKLERLLWVVCLSIGFYTIKGGVFTIQTAGAFRVWGPAGSFIEDNNALAVASVMIIPLMFYLRSTLTATWQRHAMLAAIVLTVISAAGSYSRSAFVAGICVAFFFVWKSQRRTPIFLGMLLALPLVLTFMPQAWHDRMATITDPTQEASANNRLESWATAINIANDRTLGGGFNLWSRAVYQLYGPSWVDANVTGRNAHSIYFNILAEHGWIGLALFMLIFFSAWRHATYVVKKSRGTEDLMWAGNLARMLQVSLIAYASGGATLTLGYFDLPWHLVAFCLILRRYIDEKLHSVAPANTLATSNQAGRQVPSNL